MREFSHTILHNHKLKVPKKMYMHNIKDQPDGGIGLKK